MILPYALGFIIYCLAVTLSYSDKVKASHWYYPVGLALAIGCNFLWLYVAKHTPDKHDIYISGLVWDSLIVGCYALIPVLFFGVRFSGATAIGVLLVIVGLFLTKI